MKPPKQRRLSLLTRACLAGLLLFMVGSFSWQPSKAAVNINERVNFQGRLTDANGNVVNDGDYNIDLKLYTAGTSTVENVGTCTSGGSTNCVWEEQRTGANKVTVSRGLFSIQLGSVTSLAGFDWNRDLHLGVRIGGTGSPTWDGEMTPRHRMGMAPTAGFAAKADHALTADSATTATTATNSTQLNGQNAAYYQNASNINAGTLGDSYLSTNVALLNRAGQIFTGTNEVRLSSTAAFKVQNAASGNNTFVVDTQNVRVAIGKAAADSWTTLDVSGAIQSFGYLMGDNQGIGWTDSTTQIVGSSATDILTFRTNSANTVQITASGKSTLNLLSNTADTGITIGSDGTSVNLYRAAANTLQTDDAFNSASHIQGGGTIKSNQNNFGTTSSFYDDFNDGSLLSNWTTSTPVGTITESGGKLNFAITNAQNSDWYTGATEFAPVASVTIPGGDWESQVKMESYTSATATVPGMVVWLDRNNAYLFGRMDNASDGLWVEKIVGDTYTALALNSVTTQPVWLKIRKDSGTYYFDYSTDGLAWTTLYSVSTGSFGFTPTMVGPYAKEFGSNALNVSFDDFHLRSLNVPSSIFQAASGRVGIGTTAPSFDLDIAGNNIVGTVSYMTNRGNTASGSLIQAVYGSSVGGTTFGLANANTAQLQLNSTAGALFGNVANGPLYLGTNNAVRLTIAADGASTFTGTVQGTSLNATTGINTGAAGGTQRIDASGNLVDVGNITGTGNVTLASGGSGNLTLNSASNVLFVHASDTTLRRSAAGTYTIELNDASADTTLAITNTDGTRKANVTAEGTIDANSGFKVNGTAGATTICSGGQFLQDQAVTGGIVTGGTCATAGGAGSLQGAYDGGNTVTTPTSGAARDIQFTLSDSSGTDSNFLVDIASGSSSKFAIQAAGVDVFTATSSGLTIGTALNIGSNNIVTSGATISSAELDRLDGKDAALVDTSDAVATAITGTGALNTGSITSGFGTIDTGADAITTTGTVTGGTVNASSGTLQTGGVTRIANNGDATLAQITTSGSTFTRAAAGTYTIQLNDSSADTTLSVTNTDGTRKANVTAEGTIDANSGYKVNGTSGASATCTNGQYLQNQVTIGGITTGGTCAGGPGTYFNDDFADGTIHANWNISTPIGTITESSSKLNFNATGADWWDGPEDSPWAGMSLPNGDWESQIKMESYTVNDTTAPGFFLWLDRNNVYQFGRQRTDWIPRNGLQVSKVVSNVAIDNLASNSVQTLPIWLKIKKDGGTYFFQYSSDGLAWTTLYTVGTGSLGFTPAYVGPVAKSWGGSNVTVGFDDFTLQSIDAPSLQDVYDMGNGITTPTSGSARDLGVTLSDSSGTDSNFAISIADGSTGTVSIRRADGSGTADPAQLLLLDNADTTRAVPTGLKVQAAAGGVTTALDVSDAEIVNALSIGANSILTTSATIEYTELNLLDGRNAALVDVNDAVTTAITGTGALDAGSITANFGSINTGADSITTTGTVTGGTFNIGATNVIDASRNLVNIGPNITGAGALTIASTTNGLTLDSGNSTVLTPDSLNVQRTAADAFVVQQASGGTVLFTVDTSAMIVKIGGVTSSFSGADLAVVDLEVTGSFRVGDATNNVTFDGTSKEPTLNGTARHDKSVTLTPEFEGATITGDGSNNSGTMTTDFCSGSSRMNINASACAATDNYNFYQWKSASGATNDYDVYVRWQVPSEFSSGTTPTFTAYGYRTTSNDSVVVDLFKDSSGTSCFTSALTATTSNTAWTSAAKADADFTATCKAGGGTQLAPGDLVTIRVRLTSSGTTNYARAGQVKIDYKSRF